jgi:hypothetical protein
VVLLAVVIALCCLPGCGLLQGMIENLDDEADKPPTWQLDDNADKDNPMSSLPLDSRPAASAVMVSRLAEGGDLGSRNALL